MRKRHIQRCFTAAFLLATSALATAAQSPRVTVDRDTRSREVVFRIGPIDLPANASHHDVQQAGAQEATIPITGWLQGYRVQLVDANGHAVPQKVLHHLNIIVPERRELFSPIMQRLGAAAEETPAVKTPGFVGYRVKKGEKLLLKAMLHNPTAESWRGVNIEVRMRYALEDGILSPFSIYPFYVDVMPPASIHAFDLPPGRSSKSWEGSPSVSGRILMMGGHLHRFGKTLRFEDVTAGKVIWEAKPPVSPDGEVVGMPSKKYLWRLGLPVRSDHVYRLTVTYNNPTGKPIAGGGMGTLGGVFLPRAGARWPSIDRDDPEYLKDIAITIHDEGGMPEMDHSEHTGGHQH